MRDLWWESFRAGVGGATPQRRPGIFLVMVVVVVVFAEDCSGGGGGGSEVDRWAVGMAVMLEISRANGRR